MVRNVVQRYLDNNLVMALFWPIWFISLFLSYLTHAQVLPRLQCFDGCTASPAILGREATIGDCCSFEGRGGGGFLLEGATSCVNCTNFRTINARVSITAIPEVPSLGDNLTLVCEVETEELLRPSGMIFLQLVNGNIISDNIQSTITTLTLQFIPFADSDVGRYFCNISVTSPEFSETGLRAFKDITLLSSILPTRSSPSLTPTPTPTSATTLSAEQPTTTLMVLQTSTPDSTATSVIPSPSQTTGTATSSPSLTSGIPALPGTTTLIAIPTPTAIPPSKLVIIFVVIDIGFLLIGKSYNLVCQANKNVVDSNQLYDYDNRISPNLHVGKIIDGDGSLRQTLLLFTSTANVVVDESISWTSPFNVQMILQEELHSGCYSSSESFSLKQEFRCVQCKYCYPKGDKKDRRKPSRSRSSRSRTIRKEKSTSTKRGQSRSRKSNHQ